MYCELHGPMGHGYAKCPLCAAADASPEVDRAVASAKEKLRLNPDLQDSIHTRIDRALLAEHARANELQASFDLRWKADMPAEPPAQAATDDLVRQLRGRDWTDDPPIYLLESAANALTALRATVERQAREIAEETRRANRWFDFADQQERRADRAEAERDVYANEVDGLHDVLTFGAKHGTAWHEAVRALAAEHDALRECVRELVACADESDSLAAERLYGKPHTPEYKTRELDHRQRSIEAWKAARTKVR